MTRLVAAGIEESDMERPGTDYPTEGSEGEATTSEPQTTETTEDAAADED